MTLVLEPRHRDAMRRHGEADYPREACGLIGGTAEDGRKIAVSLVPLRNARTDALRNRYLIDPDAFPARAGRARTRRARGDWGVPFASRSSSGSVGIRPGPRLAVAQLRDRGGPGRPGR